MTLVVVLQELAARGIQVEVHDNRLRYHPKSAVSTELLAEMRAHKAELLVYYSADVGSAASTFSDSVFTTSTLSTSTQPPKTREKEGFRRHEYAQKERDAILWCDSAPDVDVGIAYFRWRRDWAELTEPEVEPDAINDCEQCDSIDTWVTPRGSVVCRTCGHNKVSDRGLTWEENEFWWSAIDEEDKQRLTAPRSKQTRCPWCRGDQSPSRNVRRASRRLVCRYALRQIQRIKTNRIANWIHSLVVRGVHRIDSGRSRRGREDSASNEPRRSMTTDAEASETTTLEQTTGEIGRMLGFRVDVEVHAKIGRNILGEKGQYVDVRSSDRTTIVCLRADLR